MLVVGLTGGIASGKSTVARILEGYGARIIDVDEIGHRILLEDEVRRKIAEAFGKQILDEDGTINRRKLGEIVFSSQPALRLLNAITHPIIAARVKEILNEWRAKREIEIAVVDAAVLIEAGMVKSMDKVIVVVADRDVQIRRIMERNGLTHEEAARRVDAQIPVEERLAFADYIIENNGSSLEELEVEVKTLWGSLKRASAEKPFKGDKACERSDPS